MNETVAPSTSEDPAVDMANDDDHSRETMRDNNTLPTHKLEHLKVGANGIQLLVSTKNHLYDAKNVESGDSSFQCVGAWSEGSVQELGKMYPSCNDFSRDRTDDGLLYTRFWPIYGDNIEWIWRV
ncbi:hypothetical protein CSIM01_13679 [Colletotrichum simmondsii]|uniref:Uncharacterized protein n=1 Tax=Colletotrichum simmondsii TaxID=703756 RepID=A0A135TKQ8_9PEZI|nr:hypothetical protein CSIM01_13679 [Colletotrichum simmondsii]